VPGTWIGFAVLTATCCAVTVPDPVPFTTLERGVQSGIEQRREIVVRTADEWKTLCGQHAEGRPCPTVDFARSTVIGVFLGTRPSAGISVEIQRVERDGDALVVTYRERGPGPGEMAAQMITAPYTLATVDRFPGPVRFVRAR
jgi:PrcB C-terminal